ncbi:exported hypothetical protein [Candidatus Zixiibacteriota bacterium]|nr:exported hypothetical protein [candidate division Zixibacteria bacterium]
MNKFLIVPLIFLALIAAGCGRESTSPQSSGTKTPPQSNLPEQARSLLQQYSLSDSALFDREYPLSAIVPPSIFDTSYDVYSATFLWGRIISVNNSADIPVTNWSGSLSINAIGNITPVAALDFEKGRDSLISQTDPILINWISSTSTDYDGISALVFVKRDIAYFAPVYLALTTTPFSIQYDFSQLQKLAAYYRVDENNGMAVYARKIWPHRCPEGFIIGNWIKSDMSGDSGLFSGQWLDDQGNLAGIYSGVFRSIDGGKKVLDGWISGPILTVITGRIFGTWYYDDPRMCPLCGTGMGKFKGLFKYMNQEGVGAFDGDIVEDSLGSLKMQMKGNWHLFCPFTTDGSDNNN